MENKTIGGVEVRTIDDVLRGKIAERGERYARLKLKDHKIMLYPEERINDSAEPTSSLFVEIDPYAGMYGVGNEGSLLLDYETRTYQLKGKELKTAIGLATIELGIAFNPSSRTVLETLSKDEQWNRITLEEKGAFECSFACLFPIRIIEEEEEVPIKYKKVIKRKEVMY